MKKTCLLCFALFLLSITVVAQSQVTNLRTENLINPIGLDVKTPRFSWQLLSAKRNLMQTAYELRVGDDAFALSKGKSLWTTGKMVSDQSILVKYNGPALRSGTRYYWQVKVWDTSGKASAWSAPSFFQMGLLSPNDWKAQWITPGFQEDTLRPSPLFRKEFDSNKKVKSATAYITAHGLYEARINGERVGDAYLTPGWTSYNKRLQYQAYDVTDLVSSGKNAVGVTLGNGWYRSYLAWGGNKDSYGKDIALLFQLDITYDDGSVVSVVSDDTWKCSTGEIRYSEVYHGETIDARLAKTGWTRGGYDDKNWINPKRADFSKDVLIATYNEPIKKHETIKPLRIFTTPKGERVIDFGQNLVGWVVLKAKGKSGDKISIVHAEVLDKDGNFYTDNLRLAKQQDIYYLNGSGEETFEPHFTWHGFRYVKVDGYPGELTPDNFLAVALYSDMRATGTFTSSNQLINQLQHNIEWGLRGNFLDVPTDCPQRDERLGWTGDAQVFSRTATFLRDVNNFFTKWMKDVAADQLPDGRIPHVIPNVLNDWGGSTGWADVSTIIPWNMYVVYGDKKILEDQYESMKRWVDYMDKNSKSDLWNTGFHFGDWLFYSLGDDPDGSSAITNKYLIAQCFYAHSTQLLINAGNVLGKEDDAKKYNARLNKIKEAFVNEYLTPNGATMSNTQTSYVLALQFDMLPESLRQQAADRLVANIRQYKNHLTTGFLGTPYLCHVLSRYGYTDVAYELLLQDTYPSWLYPVKKGATTIWERWDGIKPDGSFQTDGMNSFNHYAYGAIGDWMYRVMVGLDAEAPGYKKIRIQPHIGGGFTHAAASYITPYGEVSTGWKIENGRLILDAKIPVNTTATIYLPVESADKVMEGQKPVSSVKDIQIVENAADHVVLKIGSGSYQFTLPWKE
jgi:alpha-L-rhamnosidase